MAEAVVSFVLDKLRDQIISGVIGEAKFLLDVGEKIEETKKELEIMRSFLKDADARVQRGDETMRLWVQSINDTAYDLDDVVSTFILQHEASAARRKAGFKGAVLKFATFGRRLIELHKVGSKLDKISSRLSKLTQNFQAYDVLRDTATSSDQGQRELRQTYPHVPEHDFVGFEKDIEEMVRHLTNPASHVVSICGMGGLGKTTLAKKIYHLSEVRNHFDCFAWVYVSQQFQKNDIWKGILCNLVSLQHVAENELAMTLYEVLEQKKCLVILDDVWTSEAWDLLKHGFPENTRESKILITTRRKDVAEHADRGGHFIHELQHLNNEQSWELLGKKAFFLRSIKAKDPDRYKQMQKLGQEMVNQCSGLPLAIVELGDILSTRCTVDEWERVNRNVKEFIINGSETIGNEKCKGVIGALSMSYDELPYLLKPCFLHLANFPEDSEINVKELCKMWTAEGFVLTDDQAHKWLMSLVHRGLVQVGKISSIVGRLKTCRLHDLIRDLCLSKAKNENFLTWINFQEAGDSGVSTQVLPNSKVRRLAIHSERLVADTVHQLTSNRDGCLRSLLCFGPRGRGITVHDAFALEQLFSCFYLLRVFKFENVEHFGPSRGFPKEIGRLIHLRFFSLKNCLLQLPASMENLRSLETLDLRTDECKTVNLQFVQSMAVISKLHKLINLYLPLIRLEDNVDFRLHLGAIKNLETLVNFDPSYCQSEDLSQLTKLLKLIVRTQNSLGEIQPASNLKSLMVTSDSDSEVVDIKQFVSSYLQVQKLALDVKFGNLTDSMLSPNLVKVKLHNTFLRVDPMPLLEKLLKLRILALLDVSYIGKKMVCSNEGFVRLEHLALRALPHLEEWVVEEGALSSLFHLKIHCCNRLKSYPDGLRNVTTVREIDIKDMSEDFIRSFQ